MLHQIIYVERQNRGKSHRFPRLSIHIFEEIFAHLNTLADRYYLHSCIDMVSHFCFPQNKHYFNLFLSCAEAFYVMAMIYWFDVMFDKKKLVSIILNYEIKTRKLRVQCLWALLIIYVTLPCIPPTLPCFFFFLMETFF